MKTETMEVSCGTHLTQAAAKAISKAATRVVKVEFEFNGEKFTVTPESTISEVDAEWNRRMEAKRNSPEAIAYRAKCDQEVKQLQVEVNELIEQLDDAMTMGELLTWLKTFTEKADRIGVNFHCAALKARLAGMGYIENQHVGKPPETFKDKKLMGEYIVGQVMNCLSANMPPHPITATFVERYFAL